MSSGGFQALTAESAETGKDIWAPFGEKKRGFSSDPGRVGWCLKRSAWRGLRVLGSPCRSRQHKPGAWHPLLVRARSAAAATANPLLQLNERTAKAPGTLRFCPHAAFGLHGVCLGPAFRNAADAARPVTSGKF